MGLQKLDPGHWIEPDERYQQELDVKRTLLDERADDVFAALPESLPAQEELHDLLAGYMGRKYPVLLDRSRPAARDVTRRVAADAATPTPLLEASLWIQDDLCLLQPEDKVYRLTAASLCAPSYWRLADKLGKPLQAIHGPVPEYDPRLNERVNRFFAHLKAEQPVWRGNWSVVPDPTLFQPGDELRTHVDTDTIDEHNAGTRLYVRVERQTLRRLPKTGAIAFTIRVYIHALGDLATEPEVAGHLLQALGDMSSREWQYKGMQPYRLALSRYLQGISQAAGQPETVIPS